MALRHPLDLDPPHRPDWRSGLTTAQTGPMAEDLLGVALAAAGGGLGTVAWPTVDRGIDLYLRRLRSLLTVLIQVKAFRTLTPDGTGVLDLPVDEVIDHPTGHIAMVHIPPPHTLLYERLFMIPFSEFRRRCPRGLVRGKEVFHFVGNFAGGADVWRDFLVDVEQLAGWLDAIPGWSTPVPPVPAGESELWRPTPMAVVSGRATSAACGRRPRSSGRPARRRWSSRRTGFASTR